MRTTPKVRFAICSTAFALATSVPVVVAQSGRTQIGQEKGAPIHLQDGQEQQMSLRSLIAFGESLFVARFTSEDGLGRPLTKGTGAPGQEARISISAPTTSARVGQPVLIQVQLKNVSDHELKVGRIVAQGQAELDYHINLLDAAGRAVPRTKYGAAAHSGLIDIVSRELVPVQPHQTVTQHTDLAKLFKITQPGTYTVRVGRIWPPSSKNIVWSNTLTLRITK